MPSGFCSKDALLALSGEGKGSKKAEDVDFSVLPFPSPGKASYASSVGFCVSLVYKKAATVMLFVRTTKTTVPLGRSYQYHRVYILLLSFHCANNYSSQFMFPFDCFPSITS